MEELNGETRVHPDVFDRIAKETTLQVPGVADIQEEGGWLDRVIGRGYRAKPGDAGESEEPEGRTFNISVRLEEGAVIPQVARKIQESVKEAVERMTEERVSAVNIHINQITKAADKQGTESSARRPRLENEADEN